MASYSSSGLSISTQAEIQAAIEASQRADIDAALDLSTSSPEGQINRIVARRLRLLEEALLALANAWDPDSATGDALFRLGALTGTYREPATASRVTAVLDLDADTYAVGTLEAYPPGRPDALFRNAEEVTSAGGDTDVVLVCVLTGPIAAVADSLIAVPSSGFNAITSHPDVTPGSEIESEAAFRARRLEEVESPGSATAGGIRADLSRNVPELETITIVVNATDATVDGVPPHAIEAIVYGPASPTADDDLAVATSLLDTVAAGIATSGSTSVDVVDAEGVTHAISFTRPTDEPTDVAITLVRAASGYAGDAAVASAIAAIDLPPGRDVAWGAVVAAAMGVAGVLRVTTIQIDALGAFVNKSIGIREKATISSGDVTVTSSIGVP